MRINKILSNLGYCSRTEANRWIEAGRLTIDGKLCQAGQWTWPENEILLDGQPLVAQPRRYLLYHKPKGVESTMHESDQAIHHILNLPYYVFPVGRLDKDSEGLLLLTNDGDLAHRLISEEHAHEKCYEVTLNRDMSDADLATLSNGVNLKEGQTRPCIIRQLAPCQIEMTMTQGWNRQIRRMCQLLGYKVVKLKRIRLANLELDQLPEGSVRTLSDQEIDLLKSLLFNKSPLTK